MVSSGYQKLHFCHINDDVAAGAVRNFFVDPDSGGGYLLSRRSNHPPGADWFDKEMSLAKVRNMSRVTTQTKVTLPESHC